MATCAKCNSSYLVKYIVKPSRHCGFACQNDILDVIETKIEKLFFTKIDDIFFMGWESFTEDSLSQDIKIMTLKVIIHIPDTDEPENGCWKHTLFKSILYVNTSLNPDTSTILKVFSILLSFPLYSCHQHPASPITPGLKRSNLIKTPSPVTSRSLIDLKSMGSVDTCHLQSSDLYQPIISRCCYIYISIVHSKTVKSYSPRPTTQ